MRNGTQRRIRDGLGASLLAVALAGCGASADPATPSPTGEPAQTAAPSTGTPQGSVPLVAPGRQVAPEPERWDPNVITRDQIMKSGARNGLEAVRYNARHVVINQGVDLESNNMTAQHRGPDSIAADDQLVLVVDGVMMRDLSRLQDIPANMIETIEILKASKAVLIYGLDAGGGAIILRTSHRGG